MEDDREYMIYILSDRTKKLEMRVTGHISQMCFSEDNKKFYKLVYYEIILGKKKAYKKLLKIKKQSKAVIKLLIESSNPEWLDLKNILNKNLFIDF